VSTFFYGCPQIKSSSAQQPKPSLSFSRPLAKAVVSLALLFLPQHHRLPPSARLAPVSTFFYGCTNHEDPQSLPSSPILQPPSSESWSKSSSYSSPSITVSPLQRKRGGSLSRRLCLHFSTVVPSSAQQLPSSPILQPPSSKISSLSYSSPSITVSSKNGEALSLNG
jgi:hypothetical protein